MTNETSPDQAVALAEVTDFDLQAAKACLDIDDTAGPLEFEARVRLDHTARAFARHRVSSVISAILEPGTRPIEVERDAEGRIMLCTGCGSVETLRSIKARCPTAFSCCPERNMVSAIAAIPTPPPAGITTWTAPALERAYNEVSRLREQLAQPSESGIDETLRVALDALETADLELEKFAC